MVKETTAKEAKAKTNTKKKSTRDVNSLPRISMMNSRNFLRIEFLILKHRLKLQLKQVKVLTEQS